MSDGREPDLVLVMAPVGADAANVSAVLRRGGHEPRVCRSETDLQSGLASQCGAFVLTQEALTPELRLVLERAFAEQPPWSDIPIVLISNAGPADQAPVMTAPLRGPRRTITLLERPLRADTLLATLDALLAARHRQYEIRDLLQERDSLLSSLESRVAERTGQLQRMVEEMEAFSYSVSHDLRSPLRSLAGYAEALQDDYAALLPSGARNYCDKIIRAARRMDALTQDVLAYTRVTRCAIEIAEVDLDAVIAEVVEQYPSLVSSPARIRVQRPLGAVKGHVPSLIQCFSNLLGNAVKFVPENRPPEVEIFSTLSHGRRRISIKDNGTGIAPSDQTRIFGMFERAAGKEVPGTGIGLAIVKKAVERMGGTTGVNSVLGDGSEFWIELEAAVAPAAEPQLLKNLATFWSVNAAPAVTSASLARVS